MPTKVNSDLIFSLFLEAIACLKLSAISTVSKLSNFLVSPFAKEVRIVSYAISAPFKNSFFHLLLIRHDFL